MRRVFLSLALVGTATVALIAFGCSRSGSAPRLNAGGSTFVYPMMSKWASEYEKAKGAQVNYQSVGSGGGIQQMTAKTFDFGCTDAPMNEEQLQKARETGGEVVHIPLAMGGVVPTYSLEEVAEPLRFSGPVLADIFMGKVKKWNDPALRTLNPNANLPDKDIVIVHRSEGSGTTYIWADYLSKVSPEWKEKVGVGTSVKWPVGTGQKGNEGVAGLVQRTPGSIGYVELIYATQNNIKFGSVRNKDGLFVTASLESVTAAADNALSLIPEDLRYSITDAPGKDSYPVSGTVWAVVYVDQPADKGQAVIDFLKWITHEGQEFTAELHYARLPKGLIEKVDAKLAQVRIVK
jgi:phosphate transport system substrate-binding protein